MWALALAARRALAGLSFALSLGFGRQPGGPDPWPSVVRAEATKRGEFGEGSGAPHSTLPAGIGSSLRSLKLAQSVRRL